MRQYDKTAIAAVFSTVARLVREGKPVVLCKIDGLTNAEQQASFRSAVTHNFNEKDHGFDLQQIFIIDKKNPSHWTRNTGAKDNPKDIELVDRIRKAMSLVSKMKRIQRRARVKVISPVKEVTVSNPVATLPEGGKLPIDPKQLTDDELKGAIEEIQATLNCFLTERDNRARVYAKKAELLKTIREMLEGEGFTLEDIMGIV